MTGGLEKAQRHVSHVNFITLMHGHERELCVGSRSEIDFRPGTRGKLMMAGYKIGVAVSLDNIFDNQTVRLGFFNIDVDIPLRINDRGFRARPYQVRSVRKAPEVKLAEMHAKILPSHRERVFSGFGLKFKRSPSDTNPAGDQHMSAVLHYKRKIYTIRDLPTLPVAAQKVMKLADDAAGAEKLAAIISSDPALSARVLSLVNSAYYGHRAKIATIRQTMVVIGMNMLKQLSLSVLVCGTIGRGGKDRAQLWKHSFATATASALIAKRAHIDEDVCFMAGLLHDVGKMIIEMYFPTEADMDHMEIGAWMAERWQLPPALVSAIAYHHSLDLEHLSQPIVACVHAADACAKVALSPEGSEVAPEVLRALRLSQDDFFDTAAELRRRRTQIDNLLM